MPDALSDAKAALAHANTAFPPAPKATPVAVKAPSPAPAQSNIGVELREKGKMMDNARKALSDAPKMHKGGTVKADGVYNLQAGEHVLTAPETAKVRKHAMMISGLKSLANPGSAAKSRPSKISKP